jgi:hypothetical protein
MIVRTKWGDGGGGGVNKMLFWECVIAIQQSKLRYQNRNFDFDIESEIPENRNIEILTEIRLKLCRNFDFVASKKGLSWKP